MQGRYLSRKLAGNQSASDATPTTNASAAGRLAAAAYRQETFQQPQQQQQQRRPQQLPRPDLQRGNGADTSTQPDNSTVADKRATRPARQREYRNKTPDVQTCAKQQGRHGGGSKGAARDETPQTEHLKVRCYERLLFSFPLTLV